MEKYQPEGGHVPITADDPLYQKAVDGVMRDRGWRSATVDGKSKLGAEPHARGAGRVSWSRLWQRGEPRRRARDRARSAQPTQARRRRRFSPSAGSASLVRARERSVATRRRRCCADAYWNVNVPDGRDRARAARRRPRGWARATTRGAWSATARAITDGAQVGWIYDVMVAPAWRGRGAGRGGDAPAPRSSRACAARAGSGWARATRRRFYSRLGFREGRMIPPRPYPTTEMVLERET